MKRKILALAIAGLALIAALLAAWWLLQWHRERQMARKLAELPLFQVLGRHEPEAHDELVTAYVARDAGRMPEHQLVFTVHTRLAEVTTRRLAHASDSAVNTLMREMIQRARGLQQVPGDACFRFWFPDVSGPPDLGKHLDVNGWGRLLDAMIEVIRSSAEAPAALPAADSVADKLAAVVNGMYEQFGSDAQMIAHAEDPRVDRNKVCAMTISLYERIMAWPPEDSSALIRSMTQVK